MLGYINKQTNERTNQQIIIRIRMLDADGAEDKLALLEYFNANFSFRESVAAGLVSGRIVRRAREALTASSEKLVRPRTRNLHRRRKVRTTLLEEDGEWGGADGCTPTVFANGYVELG